MSGGIRLLPCVHMCINVMLLVVSVCVPVLHSVMLSMYWAHMFCGILV